MLVPSSLHNEYVPFIVPELSADAEARIVDRKQRAAARPRCRRDATADGARAARVAAAVESAELARIALTGPYLRIV